MFFADEGTPAASFSDSDVVLIVEKVLAGDSPLLVRFAKDAIILDHRTVTEARFRMNPELLPLARSIAAAGARILEKPQRDQLRGAVSHRLVYELVRRREPDTRVEQVFNLTAPGQLGNDRSNPKDVATGSDPVEVYECKRGAVWLDQRDLDELTDIRRAGQAHGLEVLPTVACLESPAALRQKLRTLTIRQPMYHACEVDILELGDSPPRRRLAKELPGHP